MGLIISGGGGAVSTPTDITWGNPNFHGLVAQAFPYELLQLVPTNVRPTAGRIFGIRVPVPKTITATNIVIPVNQAGASLTSGQNFLGIYDSTGAKLGATADQTTNWAGTDDFMTAAISGGPISITGGTNTYIYIALLSNTASTTVGVRTLPVSTVYNNPSATPAKFFTARLGGLSAQTSLPSSVTLASNISENVAYWAGLS